MDISFEIAGNLFLVEIYDGELCKAAERFEDDINLTNREEDEPKTVKKSCFVELSKDEKIGIPYLS